MDRPLRRRSAFTLIELLVVIAIIGILASVVLSSLDSARASARDAKIIQEIRQFRTALEMFRNDNGSYPATPAIYKIYNMTASCAGCNMLPYMNPLPDSPIYSGTNSYNHNYYGQVDRYTILVRLSRHPSTTWCRFDEGGGHSWFQVEPNNTSYPKCSM